MLYAVVMAGGAGTRFWPASRAAYPKQLLDLVGGKTMINATVDRLRHLIPLERVFVLTNVDLKTAIERQVPELPGRSILAEPCKRDTAPCIGLSAFHIVHHDPDATMIVLPSDHVIHPDEQFQAAVRYAASLVDERPERLVTFGIRPTYPAESFGYIERAEVLSRDGASSVYSVKQFHEKPRADVARQYFDSGEYYWNSGIFVWKAARILEELSEHEPQMYAHLADISEAIGTDRYEEVLGKEFSAIDGKSIDYAVMEHANDIVVVEAPFEWDDVGSWRAISRLSSSDDEDNTVSGKHIGVNTTGTIIRSNSDHLVVTVGMKDCIVVHTADATLVANKQDEESVRRVVELLKEKGWTEYL